MEQARQNIDLLESKIAALRTIHDVIIDSPTVIDGEIIVRSATPGMSSPLINNLYRGQRSSRKDHDGDYKTIEECSESNAK